MTHYYVAYTSPAHRVPGLGAVSYSRIRRVPVGCRRPVGRTTPDDAARRVEVGHAWPARATHVGRRVRVGTLLLLREVAAELVDKLVASDSRHWRTAELCVLRAEHLGIVGFDDVIRGEFTAEVTA